MDSYIHNYSLFNKHCNIHLLLDYLLLLGDLIKLSKMQLPPLSRFVIVCAVVTLELVIF